jgi:hypothetical protein
MSGMDYVNYMMIEDARLTTANQQALTDIQGKADYIAKKSGQTPISWYEFQQENPPEKKPLLPEVIKGSALGAVLGLAVGAVVATTFSFVAAPLLLLTALGAFLGGAAGALGQSDAVARQGQIEKYGRYIDQFAQDVSRAPAKHHSVEHEPQQEHAHGAVKGKYTQQIVNERAAQPSQEVAATR